jgi:hypothetical protein
VYGGITPDCKYGHGPLKREIDPQTGGDSFVVPLIAKGSILLGRGYISELWKCTKCSYVELHDISEPPAGSAT